MHGFLMVERRRAAKVAGVDERGAKSAAGAFVGNREPVNSAADDEQIVGR